MAPTSSAGSGSTRTATASSAFPPTSTCASVPAAGWGTREEWTHFDGYQVRKQGQLLALVGGNARYGGVADLCGISTSDARDNVVARLAVVRRERLGTRLA